MLSFPFIWLNLCIPAHPAPFTSICRWDLLWYECTGCSVILLPGLLCSITVHHAWTHGETGNSFSPLKHYWCWYCHNRSAQMRRVAYGGWLVWSHLPTEHSPSSTSGLSSWPWAIFRWAVMFFSESNGSLLSHHCCSLLSWWGFANRINHSEKPKLSYKRKSFKGKTYKLLSHLHI